ncbi:MULTISPECIES: DEAD/DEAH box helicase [Cyanophyceae]|uniref:DEAD/DEAH box helicase n=1 Tax=Cyanophyceae TaxID=3028117 RepID=UPI001684A9FA|nr:MULTISPECIES: DEAD/DEAH box helicase [Cyanophyceae]MBD1915598.1 DEAD/DEAH box helicase [Phormidium sp. FACHB-77]MBD2031908.1 DEAD/DEAH box helicase [Phormidium sp. FACHB-322]MBD2050658.1 DEAD/DEAH box helicase [Leptolyngbya sp. FACHB-60]
MTLSFASLGLSAARVSHLESMGYDEPTAIQAEAIPHLLSGRDLIGQAQTGTGKTAAFALPLMEQVDASNPAVQVLVLTPTRELAIQVCQAMRGFRIDGRPKVLAIYGGQSIERQQEQLRRGTQIVVGTPGRVLDMLNRGSLSLKGLGWLVLDEADEMLNMGFIQDVEKILSKAPAERQTAFFSATMAPAIRELATKFLQSPVTVTVQSPKASPKQIQQVSYIVPRGWTKVRALQPILELEDPETAIIFVRTRRTAGDLTRQLQAAGYSVDEYHGDLSQSQRERLLMRFRQQQVKLVVATDIAARGLHVDDLTHVINFDMPDAMESYVHRIGRTGRAGKKGIAISLVTPLEKYKLRQIERHTKQPMTLVKIPTRAEIAARNLERLRSQVREAITSERLASFLPIVSQLSEEYDLRTVAAAALQMAYDQTVPAWQREHHSSEPEMSEGGVPLPKKRKGVSSEPREVSKAKE